MEPPTSDEDMDSYIDEVTLNANMTVKAWGVAAEKSGSAQAVNLRNLCRMLYLRHTVFMVALASGRAYDGYSWIGSP